MFDTKKLGVTFEDQLGRICLLLFCRDDFEDTLKELKYILSSEFDMQVTLLVGSRVKHAEDLCYSYNEAIALLELSEIRKNEMIFTPDEEKRLRMFRDTVYELQGIMEDNLDKKEVLIKAFSTFVRCMESYNLSDSMMRKEMFRVLSDLYYEYTLSKEEKNTQLEKCMSIIMTGSKEELVNTCKCFIENTFFEETKQNNLLVEQAKTYISEHLADELSVTSIAEQLFVTVSYFSRLFKAETGSGCNEYIVRKRMEKARVLLETTNIRIGGIA